MRHGRGRRSSFEQDDQVWAVFDRDEHPRVGEAQALCRAAQVGIAFSDPCFELWLLLHDGDFDRPDNRHQVQKALAKVCKGYDPNRRKTADFAAMMRAVRAAEDRAEQQIARRREEGDPPRRPFTTVFELTRAMRTAHDAHTGKGAD